MLKILFRKTISSLMLMTLALFLVSFNNNLISSDSSLNTSQTTISSFNNKTLTLGSGVTTSTQGPFASNNESFSFNGTANSWIEIAGSADWAMGTGDFTVEWFQNQTDNNSFPRIFEVGSTAQAPTLFGVSLEGLSFYGWASISTEYGARNFGSLGTVKNSWVHFAMVRNGNLFSVFKNGTLLSSMTLNGINISNSTTALTIGNQLTRSVGAAFGGLISNFRIVKGLAVYTGNFTKPTSNLRAVNIANPYGGSNTAAIPAGSTKLLIPEQDHVQTFSTVGNSTWTVPSGITSVEYLVVGGGGAGGFGYDTGPGGGGGAGGLLTGKIITTPGETINVSVGAGGLGNNNSFGQNGGNSRFGDLIANGGGGGGRSRSSGQDGASGGGAGGRSFPNGTLSGVVAGLAIYGPQGNNGGVTPQGSTAAASGGGGAGGAGIASTSKTGGLGGLGLTSTLSGQSVVYATGGRGGNSSNSATGQSALANTGNGGDGASSSGAGSFSGGNGGSGIVIIKYSYNPTIYNVSFNKMNGENGTDSVSVALGAEMKAASAPSRSGYIFDGYYSGTNGTGTKYYNADMSSARTWNIDDDRTLYAKWINESFSFRDFTGFKTIGNNKNLDVYPTNTTIFTQSSATTLIDMTRPSPNARGALYYRDPFKLDDQNNRIGFNTYFQFTTYRIGSNSDLDQGVTFFISRNNNQIGDSGASLGYLNSTSQFAESVAFYIDIFNGVNIGIFTNGNSTFVDVPLTNFNFVPSAANVFHIWVDYDDIDNKLVFEGFTDLNRTQKIFKYKTDFDLRQYINSSGSNTEGTYYTGISASTATLSSYIVLQAWDFENQSNIINHDTNLPNTPTIIYDYNTDPLKFDLTLSSNDTNNRNEINPDLKLQYSFDNSNWTDYTSVSTFNIADNGDTVYARAIDDYGNTSSVSSVKYRSTITFVTNKSITLSSLLVLSNKNLTLPVPQVQGYTFDGWFDDIGLSNLFNSSTAPNNNKTLYAAWTTNSNEIIFNGNGSTSGTMTAQGLNTGATANLNANTFARTGYTFAGWNTLANGLGTNFANQASYTMGSDESYELFAKWTANTYTITLNLQDGTGGDTTRTATFDAAMPTPNTTAPTRTGFTFNGYFSETNGSGNKYYNANMSSARSFDLTSNTTLYASWTANTYTITLNPSDGSGGDTTRTATFGVAMPTPNTTAPTRSGYAFSGYFSGINGTGLIYYNNLMQSQRNFELTADTTLYAKWTAFIPLAKPTLNDASIFNFTDASSAYTLPVVSGNEIVLTTGGAQASAFFLKDKIVQTDGFSTYFEIKQYRTNNSIPADGLVFVLARDTNTIGASGGGLGYQGIPNSIGVGFDNYKNGSDPDPIFTTVYKDGVLGIWKGNQSIRYDDSFVSNYASAAVGSLVRTYKVSINYNKTERILYFKIDINGTDIYTYNFTEVDVPNEYFAGFSAGTGGASVKFAIPTWYFANRYYPDGIDPNTSNAVYVEDKTVPTAPTTINLTRTTGSNASFVLSGATDNNGVINYQYSFDGITWLDYSGDNLDIFDTETNRTLYARAFDGAGNLSPSINITTRFDLTFNSNLGSDVASVSEMANSSITRPADPTRSGYSFVNWHSDVELNNVFDFSSGISTNTIIYAKWQGLPYTVTFDKQQGTTGDNSVEVTFGSAMTSADAPTRFGYNFAGYFSQANGQGTQYYNASMNSINNWNITQNTTLFANWNAKLIAISFNNGTGASVTSAVNATFAQPMPAATKPTLTGHDFMGYYTQASAQGTRYYDEDMASLLNWESETATTLFAHFTPSVYVISFNQNNGNDPSFANKSVTYNASFDALPTIDRTGYDFAGWYDATTGGNLINEQTTVSIVQDTTYYARWTPMTFTITFNKDGGTGGSDSLTASYEQTLPVATIPNRSGYTFNGYYTELNGAGIQYYSDNMSPIINYTLLSGVTLYAKWTANNYAFTFDPYGGVLVGAGSKVVTFNQAYGELPSATRVGHTFAGWYTTQVAGFEIIASEINTIFENKTFYARWNINSYNLVYSDHQGNTVLDLIYQFNQALTDPIPPGPARTNYIFKNWSITQPANMPANNLNISPVYDAHVFDNDFSLINRTTNFIDGEILIDFGVADSNASVYFSNTLANVNSPGPMANVGVISRNGNNIYYGNGTGVSKFAEVVNGFSGVNGQSLKIRITDPLVTTVTPFLNGDFSQDLSVGWTFTAGGGSAGIFVLPGDNPLNLSQTHNTAVTRTTSFLTPSINGTHAVDLYTRAWIQLNATLYPNYTIHGPKLESANFSAKPGDLLKFDWRAIYISDEYDVRAYLYDGRTNTTKLLLAAQGTSGQSTSWATRSITLTPDILAEESDQLKFVFYGGGYDKTKGGLIESRFLIDNVAVQARETQGNVVEAMLRSLIYSSPNQNNQLLTIKTTNYEDEVVYYLNSVNTELSATETNNVNLTANVSFLQDQDIKIVTDLNSFFDEATDYSLSLVNSSEFNFISMNNKLITGLGINDDVGSYNMQLVGQKNQDLSKTYNVNLVIVNVNDPPTLNPLNQNFEIQIPFNQAFSYQLPADFMIDIDAGTQLTYTVSGTLPPGVTYNSSTRTFSGTFTGSSLPQKISITGSDGIASVVQTNIGFTSTVTVVFNSNEGSPVASQTIQTGQNVIPPADPTRNGYTFGGWFSNSNLSTAYDFSGIPNGLNLFAKWNVNPYNLTFNTNGGNTISSRTQNFATSIAPVADPVRPGFIFDRWNPEIPSTVPAENITFVAQWLSDDYTFRFNQNYTNAPVIPDLVAQYLDDISTIRPANPSRVGYAFGGWFEDVQTTTPYQIPEIMPVLGNSGAVKEVFAKWTPITYRINYLEMLTSIGSNPITYTIESNNITLQTNFSQTGFNFLGFYDNPAFSGTPITSIASGSIGDKNLYANWVKANFTLTFKDDKGGTLSTQSVQFGTTIDTSFFPSTEKPGFDFIGWGDSLPSVMPASNVEVIAQFKAKQFKLIIKDSTGNIITDEMLDFDSSLSGITLPEVEIEGFEFEGWEPALPAKMPAADLEIVGKYRELPKFKIIIYGTLDEVLAEFEFRELAEVSSVTLPDLSGSNNFVFEGWDGEVPSVMPGSNVEIRPIGTKRESALNIYSADRTLIDTIQAQVGSTLNIPIPSRLGFNFAGWTDSSGTAKNLTVMPEAEDSLFASWQAKIYSIQVTVGSNDFNINVTFGEPIGNIVSPQLFGFRFEGWKNNLTGEFLNSNTIFTTPEEINLVPVYTRLNAGETLIAATRLISDFILRLFR
jgi:uncharacterized repeat protein (TIGR02543 family)